MSSSMNLCLFSCTYFLMSFISVVIVCYVKYTTSKFKFLIPKSNFHINSIFFWNLFFVCWNFQKYAYICTHNFADMVKLVDMPDLGSGAARRVGSSPIIRTETLSHLIVKGFLFPPILKTLFYRDFNF